MTVDIYEAYFPASCVYNGVARRAVSVKLTSDSESGHVTYTASVSFFPHVEEDDYAVSYDAYAEQILFEGKGRRSKKREEVLLSGFRNVCDNLAESLEGTIDWTRALWEPSPR